MVFEEKAFAHLLGELFLVVDDYYLLEKEIDHWSDKLDLAEIRPPFVELIMAIDNHTGSHDWKKICYRQENQDAIMERLFENYENQRARYLKYKAEHAEEIIESNDWKSA